MTHSDNSNGFIQFKQVSKWFESGAGRFEALKNVDLSICQGEHVAIVGKSGSGKSTLLNMLTGIDHPSQGAVTINATEVHTLDESRLATWRGANIGIVFQFFQLIPTLSILENLLLAMDFVNVIPKKERRQRAEALLARVGIAPHAGKLPAALSGGEQQRAAIARALANNPPILVADEPTGNLDSKTALAIQALFVELVGNGKTVIAVSSAIAIPLAVMTGYAFAEFVANTINFEVLTTTLPLAVYVYLIAAGLLLPILVSLPALLKGVNVSVQDALSDYGIRPDQSDAAARLPLSNSLILVVRNTLRRRGRLAVTVATMALGVAIFSTGFNVRQALIVFLAEDRNSMKHDVQVVFKNQIPFEQAVAPFGSVSNISRVEAWNGGRGRLQSGRISTTNGIGIVALPYDTDLATWDVIEGRWLEATDETEIVMNQKTAEALGNPVVGEYYPIDIKGKLVNAKLVGIVKEFDLAKIYIDKDQYDALVNPEHLVNSLMFVAEDKDYRQIIALKKDIENAIASSDLDILYVLSQAERAEIIFNHLNIILTLIVFLSLLVLVVGALGMASATGINIMERTREIGVLRAIGATPKMIYGLFVAEGMVVSVVSILLGLLLAWPLSIVASAFFGDLILGDGLSLDFAFSDLGFGITLIVTLVFGWLASRVPARRAVTVSTREALSYE